MSLQQLLLPLSFILILSACAYEIPDMTPEEAKRIEQLTRHVTPRCIGRYLVDLPDGFVLNEISRTEIEGAKFEITPMTKVAFDVFLDHREKELEGMHMMGEPDKPFLKRVEKTPFITHGKVFNRSKKVGSSGISRTLELSAWKDGYKIEVLVDATDGSDYQVDQAAIGTVYESAERATAEKYRDVNDVPEKLQKLVDFYARLKGRTDAEIPTEQGVCFPNGFLRGAPTNAEWIDLNYHLSTAEDVYFRFISMSDIGAEENTLLDRGSEINAMLKDVNGRTLRKGARAVNSQGVEEWLVMRESDPGVQDYHFVLEMNALDGNAFKPSVTFEMSSGVRKPGPQLSLEAFATRKPIAKATLGEAESVALWDKVTATLRPRLGAF